jgi:GTPase
MREFSRAPRLGPEDDEGCVEYKWRLSPQSSLRQESLATQMKFRLGEGGGVCTYYIGYRDDGDPKGLMETELESSLHTLERIALSVGASVTVLDVFLVDSRPNTKKLADPCSRGDGNLLYCARCEVKILYSSPSESEISSRFLGRVAFVGFSGVGKTSLIGALISESRDDGRGSLRFSTSKLVHEVLNGGTTCAATCHSLRTAEGVIELVDLPACDGKYRKTLFKALVTKVCDLLVIVHDLSDTDTCLP